jgi:hypothetical protein
MCPIPWGLKNQRTAPAEPIANILRRVGISMGRSTTPYTTVDMLFTRVDLPAVMTAFRGVGRRCLLHYHPGQLSLVVMNCSNWKNGQ